MNKRISLVIALSFALAAFGAGAAPFGGPDDTAYADQLWRALVRANLAGRDSIVSTPYTGTHPHGAILDTMDGKLTVQGNTGVVIVKRNYGGEGVSKQNVANNPSAYLKAVTVMYKRKGYDADNQDWFWAKFKPDGSLHTNPKGMKLAGRVAKGMNKGCIACHSAAPGGDMVFNFDR
jgi:hypothetical protein